MKKISLTVRKEVLLEHSPILRDSAAHANFKAWKANQSRGKLPYYAGQLFLVRDEEGNYAMAEIMCQACPKGMLVSIPAWNMIGEARACGAVVLPHGPPASIVKAVTRRHPNQTHTLETPLCSTQPNRHATI